jgi:carboxylesterase
MDWYISAKHAFEVLSKEWDEVMIVGFSMGGLLALKLAHEKGERVKGVAALAPAFELDFVSTVSLRLIRRLGIARFLPDMPKSGGPDVSDPDVGAVMPSNDTVPIATAVSLLDGQRAVGQIIGRISTPVWIFQGKQDHTVPVHSAKNLYDRLRTRNRKLLFYPQSWHILALDVEHHEVIEDVCGYIDELYAVESD